MLGDRGGEERVHVQKWLIDEPLELHTGDEVLIMLR